MNIRQCANGHYFDADSSERCPGCGAPAAEDGKTVVNDNASENELTLTEYTQTGATIQDIGIEDLLGSGFGIFEKTEKKDINSGANQVRCAKCMNCISPENKFCPFCGNPIVTKDEDSLFLKSGTVLRNRYTIGDVLGYGGFGVTYVGWDETLQQKVAIKEYFPTEFSTRKPDRSYLSVFGGEKGDYFRMGLERYLGEARTMAKLEDISRIVGVKDYFEENNTAYIVMKFVEGVTLKEYIKEKGTLSADAIVSLFKPLIRSLGKVHSKNIVHRDISPDNIMINENGIELIDFGAARVVIKDDEKSLSIVLKHGYAPEEQYRKNGKQGPWTDVYAMCATMYKCITGVTPPRVFDRMVGDKLVPPSQYGVQISADIENAIIKGLSINAEDRFQSMESLYEALSGANVHADAVVAAELHNPAVSQKTKVKDDKPAEVIEDNEKPIDAHTKKKAESKMNSNLVIILIAAVLIALIVIVASVLLIRNNDSPENDSDFPAKTTTMETTASTDRLLAKPNVNRNEFKEIYDEETGDICGAQIIIYGTYDRIHPDAEITLSINSSGLSYYADEDRDVKYAKSVYGEFYLSDKKTLCWYDRSCYEFDSDEAITDLYECNKDEFDRDSGSTVDVQLEDDRCVIEIKFSAQYWSPAEETNSMKYVINEGALVSGDGTANESFEEELNYYW